MSRRCPGDTALATSGNSAHEFVDFLAESGQKIWQVLPLSPTGYGDSPYQCFSAFAGNPLFIDLIALREQGLLSEQDLAVVPSLSEEHVEYARVINFKQGLLRKAAQAFLADSNQPDRSAFDMFCQTHRDWLDDYALFMACKGVHKDSLGALGSRNKTQGSRCPTGVENQTVARDGVSQVRAVPILPAMGGLKSPLQAKWHKDHGRHPHLRRA